MKLDAIKDIDHLRQAAHILEQENKKLIQKVVELNRQLIELKGGNPQQLRLKIAELEQQLAVRNRRLFGDSSEKRPKEKKDNGDKAKQTGHGHREQPNLPTIEQVHDLDEADKVCPICGEQLEPWEGQFEQSEEIDVIERRFIITKHKRKKYRCQCGQCIETAPGPTKLIAGGRYSLDFAISIAISKYQDHLPLERQVKIMKREGLIIDSQTLWDQLHALARVLSPAHDVLQHHVLNQEVIGADETYWRLMGEKGKKKGGKGKRWHVWAIVSSDAVCYRLINSRSADAAEQVLKDYDGVILCDGYSAYVALKKRGKKFRVAHCWAHVRRKFEEIEEIYPEQCGKVLDLIGQLYDIERTCPAGPDGDELRLKLRDEQSRPIVQQIHNWALGIRVLPNSALGKAIAYMGSMWNGLQLFLDDPAINIDNNATERGLRSVVLGRKNHYGSRSQRGTEVAALFYSLIESAKLVGIEPKMYLRHAAEAALRGETIPLPHQLIS